MNANQTPFVLSVGPVGITATVITTWGIIAVLAAIAVFVTRRLRKDPGLLQTAVEGVVGALLDAVAAVAPQHAERLLPFVGTLWLFVLSANLVGIIPGLHAPTENLSATAALAVIVFFSVHWYGIRMQGWKSYLRHYLSPTPLMLPFHIIGEISRTVALAMRLFGNMMSLGMAALLVLLVAGFLVPIPLLMLHIVEALVQAYIFGMLALIYIAGGIEAQRIRNRKEQI